MSNRLWNIALEARSRWLQIALAHQMPPQHEWSLWFLMAGRGAGKTRCASEWLWWTAWSRPQTRGLILAPTANDLRATCMEGQSGILNTMPRELIASYNKSTFELVLKNGTRLRGIPAEAYERLRGPEHHYAWSDECGAYQYPNQAYDMMMFGLRLGQNPQLLMSSTPRSIPLLFDLVEKAQTNTKIVIQKASTYDNLKNLAPTLQQQLLEYEGTQLGRQEIHAELLLDEGSIFPMRHFRLWNSDKLLPWMPYVVCAYDCATSEKTYNDYSAMTVIGLFDPKADPESTDRPKTIDPAKAHLIILDVWRDHVGYVELRDHVKRQATEMAYHDLRAPYGMHKTVDLSIVEDASNGTALIADMKHMRIPVLGKKPGKQDKVQRAHLVSSLVARGRVWLQESNDPANRGKPMKRYKEFLREVTTFPNTPVEQGLIGRDDPFDDWVDSLVIGLDFFKAHGYVTIDSFAPREKFADDQNKTTNWYAI